MANIIAIEPIRYQQDVFNSGVGGLVVLSENSPIDCSPYPALKAIHITPRTLPDSVQCGIAFKCVGSYSDDLGWICFDDSGNPVALLNQSPYPAGIIEEGNSPEQLNALTNFPYLAGKTFIFALAIATFDFDNYDSEFSVSFVVELDTRKLVTVEYSPVYKFIKYTDILSVSPVTDSTKGGEVKLQAQFLDNNATLSDWISVNQLSGNSLTQLQYRALLSVQDVDNGYADFSSVTTTCSHKKFLL